MTARSLGIAWIVSLTLVALTVITLVHAAVYKPLPFRPGTSIIVIGSSLTRHAIPIDPVPGGILGDSRMHVRWSSEGITELKTLDLIEMALATDATTIAVEFNALTIDTRFESSKKPKGIAGKLDEWLRYSRMMLVAGLKNLKGAPLSIIIYEGEPDLSPIAWQVTEMERLWVPDTFRKPDDMEGLTGLLQRVRSEGKQIVFYEPPRSEAMIAMMGPEKSARFVEHLEAVAVELGCPLILFGTAWPDALFRDSTHLNAEGRKRFLNELPEKFSAAVP